MKRCLLHKSGWRALPPNANANCRRCSAKSSKRRRKRLLLLGARLLAFVTFPTFLATYYFYMIATPMYATESEFVIQQADSGPSMASDLGSMLPSAAGMGIGGPARGRLGSKLSAIARCHAAPERGRGVFAPISASPIWISGAGCLPMPRMMMRSRPMAGMCASVTIPPKAWSAWR